MTVEELIDLLKTCNPDAPVVVHGFLGGFDDVNQIKPVTVALNVYTTETWRGSHESLAKLRQYENSATSKRSISSDLRQYISDACEGNIQVRPVKAVVLQGRSVIEQSQAIFEGTADTVEDRLKLG